MKYCPFCKTDTPFPALREDDLRAKRIPELNRDLSYWTKELEKVSDPARHYTHVKHRAISRIDRINSELLRRKKANKEQPKKVARKKAA